VHIVGLIIKKGKKKDHLETLAQMGDTLERTSTVGYGMDSSDSL